MTIDRDLDHLHPAMARRVRGLIARLEAEGVPMRVFETYRDPDRQAHLELEGSASKAGAFQSAHQYGLAADFAMFHPHGAHGEWSWPPADAPIWDRLHACAYDAGLTAPISWDPGHISWPDWRKLV